ncbi:hypothetical protein SpCBS45565_g07500 [Spizellomyces sp. 'palustris']|nr:hypothetical protein SpCBS45565_g07500 [Spizellomyces sp. 'palustris']
MSESNSLSEQPEISKDQSASLWPHFVDVHCHPVDTPEHVHLLPALATRRLFVMGTRPDDWAFVSSVANNYPEKVIPAFGIHPWFAHRTDGPPKLEETAAWRNLREHLVAHPHALVGEIGIDGAARDRNTNIKYPMPHQVAIFRAQLALAAELRRPVSIHTVQCHGKLLEIMRELALTMPPKSSEALSPESSGGSGCYRVHDPLPPKMMHHSFSGSPDIVRALLRLPKGVGRRFYFSFSVGINGRSLKTVERIRAVPDDRILIESDLHDAAAIDSGMLGACKLVADAKGWTLEQTAKNSGVNANEFLTVGDN